MVVPSSSGRLGDVLCEGMEVGGRCCVDATGIKRSFDEGSSPRSLSRGSSPRPPSTRSPLPSTPPTPLTLGEWISFVPTGHDGQDCDSYTGSPSRCRRTSCSPPYWTRKSQEPGLPGPWVEPVDEIPGVPSLGFVPEPYERSGPHLALFLQIPLLRRGCGRCR